MMGVVFSALSPARRRLMSGLTIGLVTLVVAVVVLAVVKHRAGVVHPVSQAQLGPVLLVPGYGGSTTGLDVLATALRSSGRDATVLTLPDDAHGSLDDQAELLERAADEALDRTGAGSVDVVGYSAGGVVARLWVRDFGGGDQARRVVTLGSPHHGTEIAGAAADFTPSQCPTACRQLVPDSALLRALNAGDETPAGPIFVSISSTDDAVVPAHSSILAGAVNISLQSVCAAANTSHGQLPADPVVISLVELEISTAAPVQPDRADCDRLSL